MGQRRARVAGFRCDLYHRRGARQGTGFSRSAPQSHAAFQGCDRGLTDIKEVEAPHQIMPSLAGGCDVSCTLQPE